MNDEMERICRLIRDCVSGSGSQGVVVGVSGGIDSGVSAALSVRALGKERVSGISLPAPATGRQETADAEELCRRLGIACRTVSIDPVISALRGIPDFTETPHLMGNIMARARMLILYYYANLEGCLVCGTSNKSEYMLGYSTKYGDSAADFQPILHLYKTRVYELAALLGIPEQILRKPPSAGLWQGQTDENDLGWGYAVIDAALQALEENGWRPRSEVEETVLGMVRRARHKHLPAPSLIPADQTYP